MKRSKAMLCAMSYAYQRTNSDVTMFERIELASGLSTTRMAFATQIRESAEASCATSYRLLARASLVSRERSAP
jgi:hypothetical protein